MSPKRSKRTGRAPRDIVQNGVTIVSVAEPDDAVIQEPPTESDPELEAFDRGVALSEQMRREEPAREPVATLESIAEEMRLAREDTAAETDISRPLPLEREPSPEAIQERIQGLEQVKNMSGMLVDQGLLGVGDVPDFENSVQREIDAGTQILGRSGEPLEDEFLQDLARSDPQLAQQFEAFSAAIDAQMAGPEPPTCILTGAAGEDPDDCTTHAHEDQESAPEPEPEQEMVISRNVNGRGLPEPRDEEDEEDGLAAAVKQARREEWPAKPIGLYVAQPPETRRESDVLTSVAHLIVPAQPSGLAIIGSFASAACGATLFVDKARVTSDDFTGDADVTKCGWCVKVEQGEVIPAFDRGKRRPVLPGMPDRKRTRSSPTKAAAEVGVLIENGAFTEALDRLQQSIVQIENGWAPTGEEILQLREDLQLVQTANERRNQMAQQATVEAAQQIESASRSRSRGPRTPRAQTEGQASELREIRVGNRMLPTLFRSLDPIGPFVIGYRSAGGPHWIVRDVRVSDGSNPDRDFAADKAGALSYAREQCAVLPAQEQFEGRNLALARIDNSVNRRCR